MPFDSLKRFVSPPHRPMTIRSMISNPFEHSDPFDTMDLFSAFPLSSPSIAVTRSQRMFPRPTSGRSRVPHPSEYDGIGETYEGYLELDQRHPKKYGTSLPIFHHRNMSTHLTIFHLSIFVHWWLCMLVFRGVDPSVSRRMKRHFACIADSSKTCQICLMNFSRGEEIMNLPCSHSFQYESHGNNVTTFIKELCNPNNILCLHCVQR